MLRHMALVRTDVSEELSASFINPSSPILVTLMMDALLFKSVFVKTLLPHFVSWSEV
jgi:hypothetical protein